MTEYWILDGLGPTLTVVTAEAERPVAADESDETPLLPGFAFRPRDVFGRPAAAGGESEV